MSSEKTRMFPPALIGGGFLGILSALPILEYLNCACCGLIITGGILASYLYTKDSSSTLTPVSYGKGTTLGLLTGVLGAITYTLVRVPLRLIQTKLGLYIPEIERLRAELGSPEIPEPVKQILLKILFGGVLTFIEIISFLVLAIIFSTLGTILGVALFRSPPPSKNPAEASPKIPPRVL